MEHSTNASVDRPMLPKRLKPGDTVALAAPSSPFDVAEMERGLAMLRSMGYKVRIPEGLFQRNRYLAGHDRHRASVLNRLFSDPTVDAIACVRGGFGALKILPFLDFDAVSAHPKAIIGFSDITALLSALYSRCGLVSFHGPVCTSLAGAEDETRLALQKALASDAAIDIMASNPLVIQPGFAVGRVLGGNLRTLCHMLATPYEPNFGGGILFFEDINESPYRVDRMLTQMKMAGCFEGIAGLVLGSFKGCGSLGEVGKIFGEIFEAFDIPVVGGFAMGHGRYNITIPLGLEATLDSKTGRLTFHKAATVASPTGRRGE